MTAATLRSRKVNRPFDAFGVLMAFLALAIVAIGLSTQPIAQQPGAGAGRIDLPPRVMGPTAFILVLGDGEGDELAISMQAESSAAPPCGAGLQQPTYEQGCGLDRSTGEVYGLGGGNECLPRGYSVSSERGWRPTVLAAIRNPSRIAPDANEGLTQYDAAYDLAMSAATSAGTARLASVRSNDQVEDQQVLLFQSLCHGEMAQTRHKSPVRQQHAWQLDPMLKSKALTAANRLWRTVVLWAEFRVWIESKQAAVASRDTAWGGLVAFWSPPQSQLVQIAVATLNRVAELLQGAIGQWVEQAQEQRAVRVSAGPAAAQAN